MRALLVFLFFALMLPAAAQAGTELTRWLSQKYYNGLKGQCKNACCEASSFTKQSQTAKKILIEASREEFFKEVAHDQIAESECEFHYLSQFDYNGDNDWSNACARDKWFGKPKRVSFKENPQVMQRQRLILEDLAPKLRELHALKVKKEGIETWVNQCKHGPHNPDYFDPTSCPSYNADYDELLKKEAVIRSSVWNSSNPAMQDYIDKVTDTSGTEFDEAMFVEEALDPNSKSSFQQLMIEKAKTKVCKDNDYFKQREKGGPDKKDSVLDGNGEGRERERKYKKILTMAGIGKIHADPKFREKYGHLECQLGVDYGNEAGNVERWEDLGLQGGVIALSLLQPYMLGALGVTSAASLEGLTAYQVVATLAVVGVVEGANAYANLSKCFESKNPSSLRSEVCAASKGGVDPLTQFELLQLDQSQANCVIGIAATALGPLSQVFAKTRMVRDVAAFNRARMGKIQNVLAQVEAKGLTAAGKRAVVSEVAEKVRVTLKQLEAMKTEDLELMMKDWAERRIAATGHLPGQSSPVAWSAVKEELSQGKPAKLYDIYGNTSQNLDSLHFLADEKMLSPGAMKVIGQNMKDNTFDDLLVHVYFRRYLNDHDFVLSSGQNAGTTASSVVERRQAELDEIIQRGRAAAKSRH